jgi:hypothetical protein
MKPEFSARTLLAAVWLICFATAVSMPLYLQVSHRAEWGTIKPALDALSDVYAPYLGLIFAFYFGTHSRLGGRRTSVTPAGILAIILSMLWNVFIVGCALLAVLGYLPIEESTQRILEIGPKFAWLVAPAIGYFFAKSKSAEA